MKLLWSIAFAGFCFALSAEDFSRLYQEKGELILTQFVSAPFPHPSRSEGHKYKEEFFSAKDHYSDSTVAVFIPKAFRPTAQVDVVVHFHGWRNNVVGVLERYKLIEQLVESQRNAVLVVPQGPYNTPDSSGGKLEDRDGFNKFMIEVMGVLRRSATFKTHECTMGRIILSGHSGGYKVISAILDHGGLPHKISEVWLFDALYGESTKFLSWQQLDHGRLLNIYTEHGGTKDESEKMMATLKDQGISFLAVKENATKPEDWRKPQPIFIFSDLEHNDVVDKHSTFRDFLKTSVLEATARPDK